MDVTAAKRWLNIKKALAWAFWLGNLVAMIGFWFDGNQSLLGSGQVGLATVAVARLVGLIATFCALTQFVLMGRQSWLEPTFGLDRLAVFHRRNGMATLVFVLLHPLLLATGYGLLSGVGLIDQYMQLTKLPFVPLASLAVVILLATVGASIYIVRKHLKFELWYAIHLANYAAVALFAWHQFANGADLLSNEVFWYYWLALYLFVAINILVWRWAKPVVQSLLSDFRVEKIVSETPTANSLYIKASKGSGLRAKGGQFVMVRFLTKGLGFQEHPFSLSMLPKDGKLRLTIRALGDFTNAVPNIKNGTKVIVSGPHGAFTHDKQVTGKALYIAGGIGITPIRSMIEERSLMNKPDSAALIYCNRTLADAALLSELEALASKIKMPIYNVLSEQPGYKGEKGYIDAEKIKRLVPDVVERDVFLCGPPTMMQVARDALGQLGVPKSQIHYERFSLHKQ